MWRYATVAVMMAALAGPAAAKQDRIYTDVTFSEMKSLMEQRGYGATLSGDEWQDPFVHGAMGEVRFKAYGIECRGRPRRCAKVNFSAGFQTENPVSLEMIDEFNESYVFGKAFLKDGTAYVEYSVNLTDGVSEGNLLDNLRLWSDILRTFTQHIGWRKTS